MFETLFLWLFHPAYPFVLERFAPLNHEPDDANPAVYLTGRRGGLIGLILSLFKLADQITFQITPGEARLACVSKIGQGQYVHIVSLQAKPTVMVAVSTPWLALILGAIQLVLSVLSLFFFPFAACVGIPLGLILIAYYFMGTSYSIHIVGHTHLRIRVYPSLLNSQSITFDRLMKAIDLMRRLIDRVEVRTRMEALEEAELVENQRSFATPSQNNGTVNVNDIQTESALAYQALMDRIGEFTRQPRAFLRELRQLPLRYPNTAAATRAEWEALALETYIGTLERFQGGQLTRTQLRAALGAIPANFPTSAAATWAEQYLGQLR
jgi:hypothetical protein